MSLSARFFEAIENRRVQSLVVAGLLAIHALLLGYSATRHSPVHLEPAFLASGISHWNFARFELYRVNPPLPRMISSMPVLMAGCETDWSSFYDGPGARPEYACGEDFIKVNGPRSLWLFTLARLAGIPINLLGAYIAYRWSRELYGWWGGFLTLILFVFDPNLLAYGEFATPDGAFTAFGILAGYSFWRWLRHPSWISAVLAGSALGLAELSKLSWLILFGLWPLLWIVWRWWPGEKPTQPVEQSNETSPQSPSAWQLGLILLISVYVINLAYAFDGFAAPLGDFVFVSTTLTGLEKPGLAGNRFQGTCIGAIPVPLPKQYILGIDSQGKDLQDFASKSYLRGEWKDGGWWYYYLYGFLVKEPLSFLALLAITGFLSFKSLSRDEVVLLVPAITLLAVTSSATEFNIHWRYVLPCTGLCCIFIGRSTLALRNSRAGNSVLAVLATSSIISLALIYPHHLTYFNLLAGGPQQGYRHLLGSSLDWGQDLIELSRQLKSQEFQNMRIILVLPARCSPESLGLFPENVSIVQSLDDAKFPPNTLVIRSRYLAPTLESSSGPINASRFHGAWSVHFRGPPR